MLKELGEYKNSLRSIFVNDNKICKLLLGENYENQEYDLEEELDKHIIAHPYVKDTIATADSFIMFDTYVSKTYGNIKTMKIVIQTICNKDIVRYDEKPVEYSGLRYDVLAEYVEELLCPTDKEEKLKIIKKFGIGSFELESVDIFLTDSFIGHTLTFNVPTFR